MGGATEQIPHQPGPAAVLEPTVLPIAYDVQVEGEAHVLGQLLQQVDAVTIATFLVILRDRRVWCRKVLEQSLQDRGLVGERVEAQLSRGTLAVPVHLAGKHERVLHQCHHTHVQPRRSPPVAPAAGARMAGPRPLVQEHFPLAPAPHAGPGGLAERVQLQGPDVVVGLGDDALAVGVSGDETALTLEGRVGQKSEGGANEEGGVRGMQKNRRMNKTRFPSWIYAKK